MNHPDYNSPVALKAFLDANGLAAHKKFGQNFLVNGAAREKIIDLLDVGERVRVWEVGPGLGAMTGEILRRGAELTAFEIDRGFARLLRELFSPYAERGRFSLVEGDVLKTWRRHADEHGRADRFFGNLPYNAAAAIIADTIHEGVRFEKMVVTVQKEVAQRMTARPASGQYSSFSVLCQWAYEARTAMELAGGSFWPVPNVASRAVLLIRRDDFPRCQNPGLFLRMTRQLFSSRRKTARNNLLPLCGGETCDLALARAGIRAEERAENLGVEALLALSDRLNETMQGASNG